MITLLAAAPSPDDIGPGLLGFLIVFAIAMALWLLLRSMIRHLRRIDVEAHDRDAATRASRGRGSGYQRG